VLAYPLADGGDAALPVATSGDGTPLDAAALNGDTAVAVERGTAEQPGSLVLSYPAPQTIRSATLMIAGTSAFADIGVLPRLESSTDGSNWAKVAEIPAGTVPTTVSFAPVTAQKFRLLLVAKPYSTPFVLSGEPAPGVAGGEMMAGLSAQSNRPVKIAELRLSPEAKVDRFEAKAGFSVVPDYYALSADTGPDVAGVPAASVVDLSSRMKSDGTLDWTPPPGKWRVLRLGCSLLGTTNHPATAEATGLEVDKFDGAAVRDYLETYLGMYRDAAGPDLIGAHGVTALVNDSIEVGAANWTPRMVEQIKRLRGYDPTPWLPALTGVVVGSRSASDAFLYDYRRTLADLISSEHYGTIASVAHEHGLKVYGEALEDRRPSLGDDMTMRSHNRYPDGRNVDLPARARAQAHLPCGHQGCGFGGAYLRAKPGCGGVHDFVDGAVGVFAGRSAPRDRPGVRDRRQPAGHSYLGPPAARRQDSRALAIHLRPALHPPRNLGRDGAAVDRLHCAQCLPVTAGAQCGGCGVLLRRRGPADRALRRNAGCRRAGPVRLRLRQRRCLDEPVESRW
jgi:hypothetical protein